MQRIMQKIFELGIIPVIAIHNAKNAVPLAKALMEGGLPVAEITFRTDAAEESIRQIRKEIPEMLVGAGTVLTIEQADKALDAGASFLMTPGFNPEIVRHALSRGALIMPGTATPGEMEQAMAMGVYIVKFFPAEMNGGVETLKAISAVYPNLKFIPTGGIHAGNLQDYLGLGNIVACGGTWMVKSDLIESGNFAEITRLTKEATASMLGFKVTHVGVNCAGETDAFEAAKLFTSVFGFGKYPGTHGRLSIQTNSIERAAAYFENRGYRFDPSSRKEKNGKTAEVYLKDEFAGFAVHLTQK